ncbi:uncharacterized protein SPSK_08119 [Sporothrix schenckii 1099-18]|uniref:Uncharacterized protein n=1 Tax=Sporothrix schenckii 1099-18 TaxID=1397361 RepID=A0A0F2MEJ7_SPOSC|nr:uncharacterized protein SPSK_08119 [Sporothrix schenckii 1099-18]KJR88108.1 hypothetical protein SPSK_08119 [Sporothrix schenckii 1099-18]
MFSTETTEQRRRQTTHQLFYQLVLLVGHGLADKLRALALHVHLHADTRKRHGQRRWRAVAVGAAAAQRRVDKRRAKRRLQHAHRVFPHQPGQLAQAKHAVVEPRPFSQASVVARRTLSSGRCGQRPGNEMG